MKKNFALRALTEGAILVALAQVLSYLKLFELPQGGSITVAMLPIFVYCARWGFGPGMLASFVYSVLQLVLDGAYAWGWESMLGDYIVAFTVLGFAGLFHKQKFGFFTGTVVGSLARFLVHYLVGVWVWGEYMPETFFGMTMTTPWFYSFLYNGSYMIVDMVICLVIGALLWKPMGKYLRGEDIHGKKADGQEDHFFEYTFSLLIPLVGFILGAILMSKETESQKKVGINCILLALLPSVLLAVFLLF